MIDGRIDVLPNHEGDTSDEDDEDMVDSEDALAEMEDNSGDMDLYEE
jgi:hypothetical protein